MCRPRSAPTRSRSCVQSSPRSRGNANLTRATYGAGSTSRNSLPLPSRCSSADVGPTRIGSRPMDISYAFATSMDTADHIVEAERLGYSRAWCYDSPALYPDVWMVLALAAARTEHIGLGPAVLVPSLRHPSVNAAAIATLADQAPGRVAGAIGSGFTGRMVLGQRPMAWADVADYVRALRALLRGDDVEWDGSMLRRLQPNGFGASRPLDG